MVVGGLFSAARSEVLPWPAPCFLASLVPDVSSYKVGELLYELPSVPCTCPWEPFLNDLDGFDCQEKVGGDSQYLLIGNRAA